MHVDFLDVGHGSSVLVRAGRRVAVLDVGGAPTQVHDFLLKNVGAGSDGRIRIEALVITHLHADHYRGVPSLLYDDRFDIQAIYANRSLFSTDGAPKGELGRCEQRLYEALVYWQRRTLLELATLQDGEGFTLGEGVRFTAVWPAGGKEMDGKAENPRSIVGRMEDERDLGARVLLTGDADAKAFAAITRRSPLAVISDVLLFPHHGGRPGSADPERFAALLCRTVGAVRVVIQNGHRWQNHPHPQTLAGIRKVSSVKRVACTELAKDCGKPSDDDPYAPKCAGRIYLADAPTLSTERPNHTQFVRGSRVKSAQCIDENHLRE